MTTHYANCLFCNKKLHDHYLCESCNVGFYVDIDNKISSMYFEFDFDRNSENPYEISYDCSLEILELWQSFPVYRFVGSFEIPINQLTLEHALSTKNRLVNLMVFL